jgi:AraC-like DNA-binding protein
LKQQDDRAYLSWKPIYPDMPLDRHHSEAVLTLLSFTLRDLTRGQVRFIEVRFVHPRPEDTTEHQRIFDCPLAFEQPRNEIVIRREDLARPIFPTNPELLERLEQFAQELLDRLYAPDTWADRVTHLIGQTLWRGEKPTLDAVAYELAISPRHLQNKLKAEGTTYRRLRDRVRKEIAVDYLKRPDVAIYDIAFLLGFSEQSAFNHAFKRWTGDSPREYRNRGLSPVPLE